MRNPRLTMAAEDLAHALISQQRYDEALEVLVGDRPGLEPLGRALSDRALEIVQALSTESFQRGLAERNAGNAPAAFRAFCVMARAERAAQRDSQELLAWGFAAQCMPEGATGGSALEDMQRAVKLAEELEPTSATHVTVLETLGTVLRERGRVADALQHFDTALAMAEALGNRLEQIRIWLSISRTHVRERDFDAAEGACDEALVMALADDPHGLLAGHAYSFMASILHEKGAPESEVAKRYQSGLDAFIANGSPAIPTARALNGLRRHEEAIALLEPHHRTSGPMIAARQSLVDGHLRRGDHVSARDELVELTAIVSKVLPISNAHASVLGQLARLERMRGDLDSAIALLERAVGVTEAFRSAERWPDAQRALFAEQQDPYRDLVVCLLDRRAPTDVEFAFEIVQRTKARSLVELLGAHRGKREAATARQRELLAQRAELQNRLSASLEARDIRKLERKLDLLASEIALEFGDAEIAAPPIVGITETQQMLDDETLLLDYAFTETHGYVWALRSGDFHVARIEVGASELSELVTRGVAGYLSGDRNSWLAEEALQRLARVLVDPIPKRAWVGTARLLVIPDGAMVQLPTALLSSWDGGPSLCERYAVAHAPSIGTLAAVNQRWRLSPAAVPFVGFGAPTFATNGHAAAIGAPIHALPASGHEVRRIATMLNGLRPDQPQSEAYVGRHATERNVRDRSSHARYLHFATHAFLDDLSPMDSALVLAPPLAAELADGAALDDLLRVRELLTLELGAEVVVCSACQTALGKFHYGEGLYGFTRALILAGARCVVASLWPVDDAPTAQFMVVFYQLLAQDVAVAEALRRAQLEMRKRWPDPCDWAGWVVVGRSW